VSEKICDSFLIYLVDCALAAVRNAAVPILGQLQFSLDDVNNVFFRFSLNGFFLDLKSLAIGFGNNSFCV
jgi:hypothetical protein